MRKECDIVMNGEKNRNAALGLVFVVGAFLGLLVGNERIRQQLSRRSKQLLSHE